VLLFIHSFLSGVGLIFFETTASTMFLVDFDITYLPYVYILTAFVSVVMGYLYTYFENRLDIKILLKVTLGFVLSIVVVFLLLITVSDNRLASMAIMVFKDVMWMFAGMEFGILVGIIFNIRQGKRLFGILMSGEILAGILGGLSVGFILQYIDTKSLLFISIVSLLLSNLVLFKILSLYSHRFEQTIDDKMEREEGSIVKDLLSNNYYLTFFVISILAFFVFYFIDYIFYFSVEQKFHDEKELASFFGLFFTLLNITNLFSSLFISGQTLSRYGVVFGLVVIPIIALMGSTSLLLIGVGSIGVVFFVVIVLKLLNEVADISILNPTFKIIYQSISTKDRMRVLGFRETVIEPVAMGVAGLLLLGLTQLHNINIVYYLLFTFALVWLLLSKIVKGHYLTSIKEILSKREAQVEGVLLESVGPKLFLDNLKSKDDIEVIYSLESLLEMKYHDINRLIIEQMNHPSKRVRLYLLDTIINKDIKYPIELLRRQIEDERESEILHKLLKLYCKTVAIDAVDTVEVISKYLNDDDHHIKEGAIIGLLQYSGINGTLAALRALKELFNSSQKEQNLLALNILSKIAIPTFYPPLEEALKNSDEDYQHIAIITVGNLGLKKFLPYLLHFLENSSVRNVSTHSLSKFGSDIFETLKRHFNETLSFDSRLSLVRVFATMRTHEAEKFLLESAKKEPRLLDEIVSRLASHEYECSDHSDVKELLRLSVQNILHSMIVLTLLNPHKFPNSIIIIEEMKNQKFETIFSLLGFIYPKSLMLQTKVNYFDKDSDKQAYAIEIIDNIASTSIKAIVLPILEGFSLEKKLAKYPRGFVPQITHIDEYIIYVLTRSDVHIVLRLSIIYEIGTSRERSFINHLLRLTYDGNSDIAQTAQWAIEQVKRRLNYVIKD